MGIEYDFSSNTTDPDGDSISYLFSWGNGAESDWFGPYNSGDTCTAAHIWNNAGLYYVKVKAKDTHDRETEWSDSSSIAIFTRGDCNGDAVTEMGDVVYIVNYLYKDGSAPVPLQAGDVNCDGVVDLADVVYLITYLYKAGPAPTC